MKKEEIFSFVKSHIEPIEGTYGPIYRCSAVLTDGLYLPCVAVQEANPYIKQAIKRFDETRNISSKNAFMDHTAVVSSFVCAGNRINHYDIRELQISPYAIPEARLMEIKGETSMSWTEFTVEMNDGKTFFFGTSYLREFFDMPSGYTTQQIKKIIPAERGNPQFRGKEGIFRERPYFLCLI